MNKSIVLRVFSVLLVLLPVIVNNSLAIATVPEQQVNLADAATTPSFRVEAFIKASNPDRDDWFGYSVAISGDTLVVGAPNEDGNARGPDGNQSNNSMPDSGAVYIFVRNGSDWTQQTYLKASNTDSNDRFGQQVAIFGNTIIVSAPGEASATRDINGNYADNSAPNSGAVYVFVKNGNSWSQQAYLKASNAEKDDLFGTSISFSGNTLVVGATGEASAAQGVNGNQSSNSAVSAGAAYVFVRNGTTWSQQAYLKASNTGAVDYFGSSVAINGENIVVGAPGEDSKPTVAGGNQNDNSRPSNGAVYVFHYANNQWQQVSFLKTPRISVPDPIWGGEDNYDGDNFGSYVTIFGDTISVTAYLGFDGFNEHYTFSFQNSAPFWIPNASSGQFPGGSVTLDEKYLIASTSYEGLGDAYIFSRSGDSSKSIPQQVSYYYHNQGDSFGYDLSLSNGTLAVGAPSQNSVTTGINGDQSVYGVPSGAVFVYVDSPAPQPTCGDLYQEAENGVLFGAFEIGDDPAASNGQYVHTPEGSGNYYEGPLPSYRVEYCFNVPTSGLYRILAKAYGTQESNTFYLRLDNRSDALYIWDIAPNTSYDYGYVNARDKADPLELPLIAGEHRLTFYISNDGARLDSLELEKMEDVPLPTCSGLIQEAEVGAAVGNFHVLNDANASGGRAIYPPLGSGNFWNGANELHKVSYCFNIQTAGTYRIRSAVYGADTLSDSFYVKVDDAPANGYLWDFTSNTKYSLDFVSDRGAADPVEIELDEGQHIVSFYVRENGAQLDTIELQLVDVATKATPICAGLTQEAESGALRGAFKVVYDSVYPSYSVIQIPEDFGDFWNGPDPRQKAEYCFNVDVAGTYRIDAFVSGSDTASDSFYVQVDGAPASGYLWDVTTGAGYVTDSVSDRNKADPVIVTLASGQHTVTVYAREDGTRLDTISLVPTTPSPQSRAIPPIAQGIHGTLRINATGLTQEIDFTQITVSLVDVETNGQSFSQQVQADRFGQFHFDGMMPGQYVVRLALPDGLRASVSEVTITATAEEASDASFDLAVQPVQEEGGNKTYLPLINR